MTFMTLSCLWCLSLMMYICRLMLFVTYDVCRLMLFVAYDVCCIMMFVAYEVFECVAYRVWRSANNTYTVYAEFLIFLIRNDPAYNTHTRDHDSTYAYHTRDHDSAYTYYTWDHDSAYNTYKRSFLFYRISPWNQKRIENCFSMSIRDPDRVI